MRRSCLVALATAAAAGPASAMSSHPSSGGRALQFSICMRAHGVRNFPNPNAQGMIVVNSSSGIDTNSPPYETAQSKCQTLLQPVAPNPALAAHALDEGRAVSRCMRAHGIHNFPDPTRGAGAVGFQMPPESQLDTHSAQFLAAERICMKIR